MSMKSSMAELMGKGLEQLGLAIDPDCLVKFALLAQELCKWNRKINLTSIKQLDEIVIKHFIDSLTVAKVIGSSGRLLDIGSGAGFPGIPLKIVHPALLVVSVDSVEKKIIFQRAVARLLQLDDFNALHSRVEALPEIMTGAFDRIVSRAFADMPTFIGAALPLLAPDGVIVAMKGSGGRREAEASRDELKGLGATIIAIDEFVLPLSSDCRTIITLQREK